MGLSQSKDWRFSKINYDFKFCETYPKVLVVPNSTLISDDILRQVAEFRSKHRIPILSWIKYDSKTFRSALLRCSQPLVGLKQKRNESDESYLNTIFKMNTNNSTNKLFIVDARPLRNAVANRAAGGGYENEDHYENCEILFLNIQNIHVMRESLRKVFEMALPAHNHHTVVNGLQPQTSANNLTSPPNNNNNNNTNNNSNVHINLNDDKNYLVNLENSKWLEHIRLVLNGALKIVRYISQHRASVLVHCSDGWDRTSQLTALSMLMMDKYYRTIRGFEVLIEKEWLSFGHRFGIVILLK
jgi:myotubularin-related protein 1/2